MFAIIQDVLFPLMSYSQTDEELWETDPHEYIRIKFGKYTPQNLITIYLLNTMIKETLPGTILLALQSANSNGTIIVMLVYGFETGNGAVSATTITIEATGKRFQDAEHLN